MRNLVAALALAFIALHPVGAASSEEVDSLDGVIEKRISLRTHTLSPPYVDSDLQNRWWDFGGDAIVNTNKHVRLTQDRSSQSGWLWSRMPLAVTNWQMDIEFKVDGKANSMFGDGFAIWITKDRAKPGPVFGNEDYFTGLGIFFDTYSNSRHAYAWPRVTAMLGDGQTKYDHDGDNALNELAACSDTFRRRDVATKARLTYIKGQIFQLQLHTKKWDNWVTCFEVDVNLPDSPYIGFSAMTGDVADNHDIISVQTFSTTLNPEYRAGGAKQLPLAAPTGTGSGSVKRRKEREARKRLAKGSSSSSSSSSAGWFLFIVKIIGVLAFIVFALAAFRTWQAQQRSRRPAYF